MSHQPSVEDRSFLRDFETFTLAPESFDHRSHVRLAYIYLCDFDAGTAHQKVRSALGGFLSHHGVDPSKYHETITRAWILAVRHFMARTPSSTSADGFIDANPELLDSGIMMTHYSKDVLFTDEARASFVEPNLDPIPRYKNEDQ